KGGFAGAGKILEQYVPPAGEGPEQPPGRRRLTLHHPSYVRGYLPIHIPGLVVARGFRTLNDDPRTRGGRQFGGGARTHEGVLVRQRGAKFIQAHREIRLFFVPREPSEACHILAGPWRGRETNFQPLCDTE